MDAVTEHTPHKDELASKSTIAFITVSLLAMVAALIVLTIVFWQPLVFDLRISGERVTKAVSNKTEGYLLLLAVLSGAGGGCLRALSSLVSHIGAGSLKHRYTFWYLLQVPIGGLMAVPWYLIFRAGFFTIDPMLTLSNVFFLTAFAFLSGMFADDSNRRLAAFFSKWSKDSSPDRVGRKPGAESRPAALVRIDRLEPENLGVGSEGAVVAVVGQGFDPGSRVVLSGAPRDTTFVDETMLKFSMVGNELEDAVKMELKVRTSKGLVSNVVILEVMEA